MEDIAITGLGVISSLGHNADDRWLAKRHRHLPA